MNFDEKLDCTGLKCPMPAMKTKKALAGMNIGQVLLIITTDKASCTSIPSIIRQLGHELFDTLQEDGKYLYLIRKA